MAESLGIQYKLLVHLLYWQGFELLGKRCILYLCIPQFPVCVPNIASKWMALFFVFLPLDSLHPFYHPLISLLVITNLVSVPVNFFFFFNIPHIIEIIWYLSFSGWLISFSIMALRALLLAVSWRPSSSSRDHLHSLALVPFPVFKACKGKLNPSHASDLSIFFISSLWPTLLPVSSNFKDSCYYGVPIWIVQDNFCI